MMRWRRQPRSTLTIYLRPDGDPVLDREALREQEAVVRSYLMMIMPIDIIDDARRVSSQLTEAVVWGYLRTVSEKQR